MHAMAPPLLSSIYIFNPVVHKMLSESEETKEQRPENSWKHYELVILQKITKLWAIIKDPIKICPHKRGEKFMQHDKGGGESLETDTKSKSKRKTKVYTTAYKLLINYF